jgi:hypothetical protein
MTALPTHTVADCTLDGAPIALARWPELTSAELARVVGLQCPGDALESAASYTWRLVQLPLAALERVNEDGEAPEGGWIAAYQRHCASDARAVADGSPQYAGRSDWLKNEWAQDTRIYPLFLVEEEEGLRLWDGYHRLAGAFFLALPAVWAVVGTPTSP